MHDTWICAMGDPAPAFSERCAARNCFARRKVYTTHREPWRWGSKKDTEIEVCSKSLGTLPTEGTPADPILITCTDLFLGSRPRVEMSSECSAGKFVSESEPYGRGFKPFKAAYMSEVFS